MQQFESEIFIGGPLDSDSENRNVQQPYIRDAKYFRMGTIERGTKGSRTSFLGNQSIELAPDDFPAGVNTVIGMCKWIEKKAMIFFYHNSNGDHGIYCYYVESDTFSVVAQGQSLLFDLDYPIIDAEVVGDLLCWTDGKDSDQFYTGVDTEPLELQRLYNPPMRINAQRAIDGDYPDLDLQSIEALIWPPWYGPTIEYGSVLNQPNQLRNLSFEFVYQWGYIDGEWSVFSPLSDLAIPKNQEWVQGPDYSTPFADNVISVTVDTGIWRVRKIRIAVRINQSNFFICREINKDIEGIADNDTFVYDFFNNTTYKPITTESLGYPVLNDNMPQVAKRQNYFTATNQLIYGAFWQDYDNVEMDYEVTHVANEITTFKPDYANIYAASTTVDTRILILFDDYGRMDVAAGDTYVLPIVITTPNIGPLTLTYTFTTEDILAAEAAHPGDIPLQMGFLVALLREAWVDQINTAFGTPFVEVFSITSIAAINTGVQAFIVEGFNRDSTNPVKPFRRNGVYRSLKKGWRYYVCIQYYDRGLRSGTVQKDPSEYILDIPFPSAEAARDAFTNPNNPYYVTMQVIINNLPPIWSDSYSVVVKKVRRAMMQTTIHRVEIDSALPQTYKISYDNYYTNAFGARISYIPQVGDVVRFLTKNIDVDIELVPEYVTQYQESQVVKVDLSGGINGRPAIWISQIDLSILGEEQTTGWSSQLIEVYQAPLQEDNSLWFEIFDGEIGNAHTEDRYHKGTLSISGSVFTLGNMTSSITTILDLSSYEGDPSVHSILFENDLGESQLVETTNIIDLGGGEFKITVTPNLAYDFSTAQNGTFLISADQVVSGGVSTTPVTIDLDWGDIYYRQRIYETGYDGGSNQRAYYYVEDVARSDYYVSDYYPLGRPAFENAENKRYYFKADGIHSGSFVDQTLRNNLSDFTGLKNRVKLSELNGEITRIVSSNKTVHFIQAACTTPVYNGTYAVGGDGQVAQPAFTNNTFGDKGREVAYGSIHPRTVRVIDGVVFLYDYNHAAWAKLTDGGHASISSGKYRYGTAAYNITQQLSGVAIENQSVFSFVDELNKEYTTCFYVDGELVDAHVFNYTEDGWSHRIDYPVIWAESLFSILLSTDGWQVYKHNSGNELEFYGTQYASEFTFVFNDQGQLIKRLLAIGLKTDSEWAVTNISIPKSVNYPSGMTSEIPAIAFEAKEEYLWAAYLNDKSNIVPEIPDLDTEAKALINGRNLLGSSAEHTLVCQTPESPVTMRSIHIVSTLQRPIK